MSEEANDLSAILPDGRRFSFWEQKQIYNHELHVDIKTGNDLTGDGSISAPFATINAAASITGPNTKVRIHAGTYRECVRPAFGGLDAQNMVCYEAFGDGEVKVKATEIAHGFERSVDYLIDCDENGTEPIIWKHCLNENMFHGYNPFGIVNCIHEKNWLRYGRVEQESSLTPYFLRRGMIYIDGNPLKQVQLYRLMRNNPGSYWVEENGLTIHFRMPDDSTPEDHLIEVSCREQNFVPAKPFLSYIKVKGLTMLHAANGAPVPQIGALSCGRGHHWIIEDCTIAYANALGIDIGNEGWSLKWDSAHPIGYTVLRRNQIFDCGVCGIAGIRASYTLVEDNVIARTGWQHMEYGWEASALKFHDCEDSLFRRNIFRDSDNCDGLWLDCNNYNDRITQNLFLNIRSPHAMIFIECNRGMTNPREILIDNNILWKSLHYKEPEKAKATITIDSTHWNEPFDLSAPIGEGIAGYGTDDLHISHNLIGCMDGIGYSQNIIRGRMHDGRGGTSRDSLVLNNVFYNCKSGAIRLPNHQHSFDGNYYSEMPDGFLILTYPAPTEQLDLTAWRRFEGFDLNGGYAAFHITVDEETLTMHISVAPGSMRSDIPETSGYTSMRRQTPDAKVKIDYFGKILEGNRLPGPLELTADEVIISIDPRKLN